MSASPHLSETGDKKASEILDQVSHYAGDSAGEIVQSAQTLAKKAAHSGGTKALFGTMAAFGLGIAACLMSGPIAAVLTTAGVVLGVATLASGLWDAHKMRQAENFGYDLSDRLDLGSGQTGSSSPTTIASLDSGVHLNSSTGFTSRTQSSGVGIDLGGRISFDVGGGMRLGTDGKSSFDLG